MTPGLWRLISGKTFFSKTQVGPLVMKWWEENPGN